MVRMMNESILLDECLERVASGLPVADCLPKDAELAYRISAMLYAAAQVRLVSDFSLSAPQRLRAKVTLRNALAEPATRQPWWAFLNISSRTRGLATAVVLILLLASLFTTTVAVAGQPGELVYGIRIAAERIPTWWQRDAVDRAEAELALVDRRLVDLVTYYEATGRVEARAMNAAMNSAQEAAHQAQRVAGEARAGVATRLAAQAQTMTQFAEQVASPELAAYVRTRARWMHQLGVYAQPGTPIPQPTPPQPTPGGLGLPQEGESQQERQWNRNGTPPAADPHGQGPAPARPTALPVGTPGGQQQPAGTPGGQQQQPTATPGGQQQPTATPGGQQQPTATPGGQQQPTGTPGGQQQQPTATPGGLGGAATPGGQNGPPPGPGSGPPPGRP